MGGGKGVLYLLVALPMILIITSIVFIAVPFNLSTETMTQVLPITIGAIVFIVIGELIIVVKKITK